MTLRAVGLAGLIMSPVLDGIKNILRTAAVAKILGLIVIEITIWIMTYLLTRRAGTMKSFRNELVDKEVPMPALTAVILKTDLPVPIAPGKTTQDFPCFTVTDSSVTACFVSPIKAGDWEPDFFHNSIIALDITKCKRGLCESWWAKRLSRCT